MIVNLLHIPTGKILEADVGMRLFKPDVCEVINYLQTHDNTNKVIVQQGNREISFGGKFDAFLFECSDKLLDKDGDFQVCIFSSEFELL